MHNFIMANELLVRLFSFLGVFALVATGEAWAPRRSRSLPRCARWPHNIGVAVINALILRLFFPTAAVGLALFGEARGWGLLNLIDLPYGLSVVITVVMLDGVIYLQHVMFHAVPALWRLHRMHHADQDFDVTTGLRFHPIEILLSMVIKLGAVAALGPSALGVLIFEVLLNAAAMFNHGNWRLPLALDRVLRWFVVTPDMHRLHHSTAARETNSNFGFSLPWWDRLFGTYRDQPASGHDAMTIGIEQFRDITDQRLDKMLIQPFRGEVGTYPLNRR